MNKVSEAIPPITHPLYSEITEKPDSPAARGGRTKAVGSVNSSVQIIAPALSKAPHVV